MELKNHENDLLEAALYLIPTPIGNLEDITARAKRILTKADIVACEDTRNTGLLLQALQIRAQKLESYHDFNEATKSVFLIDKIKSGASVALVSDAGTPAVSDPGYKLVHAAIEKGVKVIPLPGPTAFVPALIASGMAVHSFAFLGFPPQKKGRHTFLTNAANYDITVIFYESTHRIIKLVDELLERCGGERRICIAREISKIHEEFLRGTISEIKEQIKDKTNLKGEFVVVLEGKPEKHNKTSKFEKEDEE